MRLRWALACCAASMGIAWVIGGSIGAALNAPGVLMVVGAKAFGVLPGFHERDVSDWAWLGTILSGLFWGGLVYVVLGLAGRMRKHGVKSGAA